MGVCSGVRSLLSLSEIIVQGLMIVSQSGAAILEGDDIESHEYHDFKNSCIEPPRLITSAELLERRLLDVPLVSIDRASIVERNRAAKKYIYQILLWRLLHLLELPNQFVHPYQANKHC